MESPLPPVDAATLAQLRATIEDAFERRASLTVTEIDASTRPAVEEVIDLLESGRLRVAEPLAGGGWQVNEWLKKAVLLYFRCNDMQLVEGLPGAVLGQGADALRRLRRGAISASSASASSPARSRAAARISARTWC